MKKRDELKQRACDLFFERERLQGRLLQINNELAQIGNELEKSKGKPKDG